MKRLLAVVAMLGLTGLGFNALAQETQSMPSAQSTPSTQTPDSMQQPVGTQGDQRSARSFEGKITKSGDKLVLRETASQTAYQLDDQSKAQHYEGKQVKVMATLDPSTKVLHVVDITPSESK
jgi:hypothetical protein